MSGMGGWGGGVGWGGLVSCEESEAWVRVRKGWDEIHARIGIEWGG